MSRLDSNIALFDFYKSVSAKRFDTISKFFELYQFQLNEINKASFYSPAQIATTLRSEGVDLKYMVKQLIGLDNEICEEPMPEGTLFKFEIFCVNFNKGFNLYLSEEKILAMVKTSDLYGRRILELRFNLNDFLNIVFTTQPELHGKMKKTCKSAAFKKAFAQEPVRIVIEQLENFDCSVFEG